MKNLLDDAIAALPAKPLKTFVNIGAHKGLAVNDQGHGDPLVPYILQGGWTGLMVEPIIENYEILVTSMKHIPRVYFENCVVSDSVGVTEIHSVSEADTGWDYADQISTILPDRGWVAKARDISKARKVPMTTLSTLLDKHCFASCDIVKIDTEGAEYMILKQFFQDNHNIRPTIIYYEHRHLKDEENAAVQEILRSKGYFVAKQKHPLDSLAVDTNVIKVHRKS